jgi:hypothetical protein
MAEDYETQFDRSLRNSRWPETGDRGIKARDVTVEEEVFENSEL